MREKVFISEDDQYLFGNGTHYRIYSKLGAHPSTENGQSPVQKIPIFAPEKD